MKTGGGQGTEDFQNETNHSQAVAECKYLQLETVNKRHVSSEKVFCEF